MATYHVPYLQSHCASLARMMSYQILLFFTIYKVKKNVYVQLLDVDI